MKILLTGATGYIGKRLLPVLIREGREVVCCVRDSDRFKVSNALQDKVTVIENDLLDYESLTNIPKKIDGAYYLVHSMSASKNYQSLEQMSAINFRNALNDTNVKHVVYLSGIVNESELSDHLESRRMVEMELSKGNYKFTTLRAGIIVGSCYGAPGRRCEGRATIRPRTSYGQTAVVGYKFCCGFSDV